MANHHQALHAYACDCITHHLFHPNGSDCIGTRADEDMMHQVAADDSLQSKPTCPCLALKAGIQNTTDALRQTTPRSSHLALQPDAVPRVCWHPILVRQAAICAPCRQLRLGDQQAHRCGKLHAHEPAGGKVKRPRPHRHGRRMPGPHGRRHRHHRRHVVLPHVGAFPASVASPAAQTVRGATKEPRRRHRPASVPGRRPVRGS